VIEVTVAVFTLALGMLAAFTILDASSRSAFRNEQSQDLVNVAQSELEAIRNLDYAEVALTAAPAASTDPNDPRERVSGQSFELNRDGTGAAEMAVNGVAGVAGGTVDPGPTPFASGDVSGEIFRFVVWRDDPSVTGVGRDLKRVVVAVVPSDTGLVGDRTYYEVQSDVADPNDGVLGSGPPPDPGQEVDAQHFWLSDTQQDGTCARPRQPITASHATHDTNGSCAGGNAPDAMYRTYPPRDPNHPTQYDYSTDVGAEGTGAQGTGLQLNKQSGGQCAFSPGGGATQMHRWITPALNLTLSNELNLELFTRKPDGGSGAICVFIYNVSGLGLFTPLTATMSGSGLSSPSCVPRPLILLATHFVCSSNTWPTSFSKVTIEMRYLANLGLISRMGLGLGVPGGGTPSNQFQFQYDHATYPSRLDVFPLL
jgi:hypothetical protein